MINPPANSPTTASPSPRATAALPTNPDRERQRAYEKKSYQKHRERRVAKSAAWVAANYDRFKTARTYRRHHVHPIAYALWQSAKQRAARKGLEFDITVDDIDVPEFCPVFGIKLELSIGVASANSPSLDRKNPALGYTRGNIQVLSHKANTGKSNSTIEDLRALLAFMERDRDGVDVGSV